VNLLVGIGLLGCTGQIEDSGATGTGGGLVFEKLSGRLEPGEDDVFEKLSGRLEPGGNIFWGGFWLGE
jgi:hypothetical protein